MTATGIILAVGAAAFFGLACVLARWSRSCPENAYEGGAFGCAVAALLLLSAAAIASARGPTIQQGFALIDACKAKPDCDVPALARQLEASERESAR